MTEIAMKTANDYITDIFCKEFNEIEHCLLIVLGFFVIAVKNIMVNSRNGYVF